jgi:hypothetical protein
MKLLSLIIAVLAANVCVAGSIDTNYYNMHLDSDSDGWNNWNEYLAGTDPVDPASKPRIPVRMVFDYAGYLGPSAQSLIAAGRSIHMTFYDSPSMDGWPIYTLVTNSVDFTFDIPFEGDIYVWAAAHSQDTNYDPERDPAALITFDRAFGISFHANYLRATLTEDRQMRGFPRFRWEPVDEYDVTGYSIIANQGRVEIFRRFVESPRNYLHEGDYLFENMYGVGPSEEPFVYLIYHNRNVLGYDYDDFHVEIVRFVTNTVTETPVVVSGYDTTFVYARNDLAWTMDANASWYQIKISSTAAGTPALVTMPRTLIPFKRDDGQFSARLPFFAGDVRSDGGSWTNARYWAQVTTGMEMNAPVSSSWHPFRLAVSTNTSKSVTGQLSYAGTNYFSASASTNPLPVVVQFYTSPLYVGLPDAQIQIAASAWTTNATAPTANYEIRGLRKGQDYYGMAFVDVNTNKTLGIYESRGVGYDFTKAKPIPIRVPSHELVTTNYNMTIIDTDIDNDGLPDIWEWYKSGTITNGPLELGSM